MKLFKKINLFVICLLAANFTSTAFGQEPLDIYAQEIQNLKNSDPSIKVKLDKKIPEAIRKLHRKIDLLKQKYFCVHQLDNFSFININRLTQEQAPKLFETIEKYSQKLHMQPYPVFIDWKSDDTNPAVYFSVPPLNGIAISEKMLESSSKEEIDVQLAWMLSYLKVHENANKNLQGLITGCTIFSIATFLLFSWINFITLVDEGIIYLPLLYSIILSPIIGSASFLSLAKLLRNIQKQTDLKTIEILDNPNSLLNFLEQQNDLPPKEKKKQYQLIFQRIDNEIKEIYPQQAQAFKKEALISMLKKTNPSFLSEIFSSENSYEERINYITKYIKKLRLKQIAADSALGQKA